MADEVRAAVQYGDMRGTIAIDGWDHITALSAGAGGRKGYVTVGVSFYGEPDTCGADLELDCYVYGVDESILDGTPGPDAIRKYAERNGHLPVFRFPSKLNIEKVLKQIKRLSIVLQDNSTEGVPLMLPEDETYHDE